MPVTVEQMTFGEMQGYTKRFNEIMESNAKQEIKDSRLASLMSDLESAYQIPLAWGKRRADFEANHPELMQLYRSVSRERVL
ncbi:hypothetical protein [Sediminibacillus halophilus]|uniref:Uncharacterized protein n=1 Tax=Sediminibacillus halophilus TaxID=482461 RepID=A0A1G9QXL8_9BACI|nr:hypothetical protein [Sediminibacillus halophilus]SDM15611.1 hypothetical protein SAMN05216244_1713 [Sediminibacillus halophilus]